MADDSQQDKEARYIRWAIVILIGLFAAAITIRLLYSEQFRIPAGDELWSVSITASLPGAKKADEVSLSPPWNTAQLRLVSQKLQHMGMLLARVRSGAGEKRGFVLRISRPGDLVLIAEFTVYFSQNPGVRLPDSITLSSRTRERYLASGNHIDPANPEIARVLNTLRSNAADGNELVKKIFDFSHSKLVSNPLAKYDDAQLALRTRQATTLGRSRAMVGLCRAAEIPARIVTGFILTESAAANPHYWVEVFSNGSWKAYDPAKGYAEELPANYLAFNRGDDWIVRSINAQKLNATFRVQRNYEHAGLRIFKEKHPWDIFDLERFSPDTRTHIGLLMLLPLGVLITVFCRSVLGIRSYGTFTPMLLALAAVYADWIAALILLLIVITFALSGRSALPDKLTRIPRLGIMFTMVVMAMVLGVSLMEYFQMNRAEEVVLLPIVILTILIDRFYSVAEEIGVAVAIRRLWWTFFISLLCYPVLKQESLGNLLITYPEAHFLTLSLILLMSGYKGGKLYDYKTFNWIKEPAAKRSRKKNKKKDTPPVPPH